MGLLEQKGHKVRLVDCPAWNLDVNDVLRDLKKFNPDIVIVGTSFTSLNNDLVVSRKIKEEFDIPIVMVGLPM